MDDSLQRLLQNTVLIEFVLLLVIAGICGAVAQRLAGNKNAGCLGSIALGFIGAILGTVIARKADLPIIFPIQVGGKTFPIIKLY